MDPEGGVRARRSSSTLTPPLTIRAAVDDDLDGLVVLLARCVAAMRAAGIEQWDDIYPNRRVLAADIAARAMHVGVLAGSIAGIVVLNEYQDPEYADVPWTFAKGPVAVVHRLMIDPTHQQHGLARELMAFVEHEARRRGYAAIRLDAFTQNPRALRLYQGLGYRDAGGIQLRKGAFRCFEKGLRT